MPESLSPELRAFLAELYDTEELGRQAARDAGLNLSKIKLSLPADTMWTSILEQASKEARVSMIFEVLKKDYPSRAKECDALIAASMNNEAKVNEPAPPSDSGSQSIDDVPPPVFVVCLAIPESVLHKHHAAHALLLTKLHECLTQLRRRLSEEGRFGVNEVEPRFETTLSGAFIVTREVQPHWYLVRLANELAAAHVPVRVGVAKGRIKWMYDVDGSKSAVGACVTYADALARHPSNDGCLFLADGVCAVEPRRNPPRNDRPDELLEIGPPEDFSLVAPPERVKCARASIDVVKAPPEDLPECENEADHVLFSFDFPPTGAFDSQSLQTSFQRVVEKVGKRIPIDARNSMLFIGAGRGGVLALRFDGGNGTEQWAERNIDQFVLALSAAFRSGGDSAGAEPVRLSLHYGRICVWRDVLNRWRPAGHDVLAARALTDECRLPAVAMSHAIIIRCDSHDRYVKRPMQERRNDGGLEIPRYYRLIDDQVWNDFLTVRLLQSLQPDPPAEGTNRLLSIPFKMKVGKSAFLSEVVGTFKAEARRGIRHAVLDSVLSVLIFTWIHAAMGVVAGNGFFGSLGVVNASLFFFAFLATVIAAGLGFGSGFKRFSQALLSQGLEGLGADPREVEPAWNPGVLAQALCRRLLPEKRNGESGDKYFARAWHRMPRLAFAGALIGNAMMGVVLATVLWFVKPLGTEYGFPGWTGPWFEHPFLVPAALASVIAFCWAVLFHRRLRRIDWTALYESQQLRDLNLDRSTGAWVRYRIAAVAGSVWSGVMASVSILMILKHWLRSKADAPTSSEVAGITVLFLLSCLFSWRWTEVARADDKLIRRYLLAKAERPEETAYFLSPVTARMWWSRFGVEEYNEMMAVVRFAARHRHQCWAVVDQYDTVMALSPDAEIDFDIPPPFAVELLFTDEGSKSIKSALQRSRGDLPHATNPASDTAPPPANLGKIAVVARYASSTAYEGAAAAAGGETPDPFSRRVYETLELALRDGKETAEPVEIAGPHRPGLLNRRRFIFWRLK